MKDVRTDRAFFGRSEELSEVAGNLMRGKHTLILGAKGMGKSRLIEEAVGVLRGDVRSIDLAPRLRVVKKGINNRRIISVRRVTPLGECLTEIACALHSVRALHLPQTAILPYDWEPVRKIFTRLGSVRQQEAVIDSLGRSKVPWLVILDSLDRMSAAHQQFLEDLLGCAVICAAVVRLKAVPQFRKIWSSFSKVELDPFDEATATRLIRHCIGVSGIRVVDPDLYVREILKSANGNPFFIKNFVWLGSRERNLSTEEIRKVRRSEEGELFNMGPIYILLASILTLFKIFSFGTDNREFYIYFSALGFIVYLVFRVFRTFFLFKPQR